MNGDGTSKLTYSSFKNEVGRLILMGAIAYCVLVTIGLVLSTVFKVELSQTVRDFMMIILTWFTTKAGTVIDHQYGSSAGSEGKTQFQEKLMEERDNVAKIRINHPAAYFLLALLTNVSGGGMPNTNPDHPDNHDAPSSPAEPVRLGNNPGPVV